MTLIQKAEKRRAAGRASKKVRWCWRILAVALITVAMVLWHQGNLSCVKQLLVQKTRALEKKFVGWEKTSKLFRQRTRVEAEMVVVLDHAAEVLPRIPLALAMPLQVEPLAVDPVERESVTLLPLEKITHHTTPRRNFHGSKRGQVRLQQHQGRNREKVELKGEVPTVSHPMEEIVIASVVPAEPSPATGSTTMSDTPLPFRTTLWNWIKKVRPGSMEKLPAFESVAQEEQSEPAVVREGKRSTQSNGMNLLAVTMRDQVARLNVRGVQIETYSSRALINGRIVQQGERIACEGKLGLTFCGVENGNLLFRDDAGNEHWRSLRGVEP